MSKTFFGLVIFVVCAATATAAEVAEQSGERVGGVEPATTFEPTAAATATEAGESSDATPVGESAASNLMTGSTDGERIAPEIDAMLRRIEEQRIYLKTLDHLRAALEKERSIVKLMRECEEFDVVCTGEGLQKMRRVAPSPAARPSAPRAVALPSNLFVAGVVADKVLIRYQGRDVAVRVGERIGGFVVKDIHIDAVTFERNGKRVRVPVARRTEAGE